jgi:uncharacterized Zn finger protein
MPFQVQNLADYKHYCPSDHALDCPQCGPNNSPYLHMQEVDSAQDQTVRIKYRCELCGGVSTLNLEQYKGQTLLHWTS